jgi:hypothetical protein
MTRDDIIRLAREADAWQLPHLIDHDGLERFAALVAAAEREACAKFLIDLYESDGGYHPAEEFTKQAVNAIRARGV